MSRVSWLVVVLSCVLCLPWLERPFSSRGEPREALIAQSMISTGNWISPPAYDGAVPSKPPFCHWLMSLASIPAGEVTEASCRLPSAIAFVLFMYAFFTFLARRTSRQTALSASLILLTSFEWLKSSSSCRVDTILATSMAGALIALFRWEEQERRGFPVLAALLLTVAALTKGPVGIVLPLGIWGLFGLSRGPSTLMTLFRMLRDALIIVVPVLCIVSVWYIAGYYERGDEFLAKIWYENVQRFTSTMEDEPHKHSVFYLFGMLALGLMPWSIFWLVAVVRDRRAWWRVVRDLRQPWSAATDLQRFSVIAVLVIVSFFCIPSSKRSVYLLPAYPFIALLAAHGVERWLRRTSWVLQAMTRSAVFLSLLPLLIGVVIWILPEAFALPDTQASVWASLTWWKLFTLAAALFVLRGPLLTCVRDVAGSPIGILALGILALVVSLNAFVVEGVMYHLSPKRWVSSPGFMRSVEPAKRELFYSFGSEMYATSFYLQKPFRRALNTPDSQSLVVLEARNVAKLQQELKVTTRELSRFTPGIDSKRGELVVVEVSPYSEGGGQ